MTLAASRYMFVQAVWTLDLKAWIECHASAFEFFGAVPKRLVPDYVAGHIIDLLCPPPLCGR
jgi:transposase